MSETSRTRTRDLLASFSSLQLKNEKKKKKNFINIRSIKEYDNYETAEQEIQNLEIKGHDMCKKFHPLCFMVTKHEKGFYQYARKK